MRHTQQNADDGCLQKVITKAETNYFAFVVLGSSPISNEIRPYIYYRKLT